MDLDHTARLHQGCDDTQQFFNCCVRLSATPLVSAGRGTNAPYSKPKKGQPSGGGVAAKGLSALIIEAYFGASNEAKERRALKTQALFRALCQEVRRYVAGAIGDEADAARRTYDILTGGLADAKVRVQASKTHRVPAELLRHLDEVVRAYRP